MQLSQGPIVSWIICVTLLTSMCGYCTADISNVSLTVEGGVSLIGPHCPGTVRLFCEGIELYTLGWTYNEGIDVIDRIDIEYQITPFPIIPTSPAFVAINVTSISSNRDTLKSNFSSVLTVNLLELNRLNIRNISCGDMLHQSTQQVDIKDYFLPTITATFQLGILSRIKVLISLCSEYNKSSLKYTSDLSGPNGIIQTEHCAISSCTIVFTKFSKINIGIYYLKIVVSNHSHILKEFRQNIATYIGHYLSWRVNSTNCKQFSVICDEAQNNVTDMCNLTHTSDNGIPTNYSISTNTLHTIPYNNPGAIHLFKLSVVLNNYFWITDSIKIGTSPIGSKEILILTIASLFLLLALIQLLTFYFCGLCKSNIPTSNRVTHVLSAVILLVLFFTCVALLVSFGIIVKDVCTLEQNRLRNTITYIVIVVACLGIIFVGLTWAFTVYGYSKHRGKKRCEGACHTLSEMPCTEITRHRPSTGLSESESISNKYYYPDNQERRQDKRSAYIPRRDEQPYYDTLDYSTECTHDTCHIHLPIQSYTKLTKETMLDDPDAPGHYSKSTTKEEPKIVPVGGSSTIDSNVRVDYYLHNVTPSTRTVSSFYESVDMQSDSDCQSHEVKKPRKKPKRIPIFNIVHEEETT